MEHFQTAGKKIYLERDVSENLRSNACGLGLIYDMFGTWNFVPC